MELGCLVLGWGGAGALAGCPLLSSQQAEHPGRSGFIAATVLIGAFVAIERHRPDPLVPLRIFSNRSLATSDAAFLLMSAALFGMWYFCTLYLQQVLGYSALKTGVAYLPLSLILIEASAGVSTVVDRITPKPVLAAGLLMMSGGFIFLTQVSGHGDYTSHLLPAMVILGIGIGLSFVAVTIAATSGVAPGDSGVGSGLLNATSQVGGALGLAILSTISASRTASETPAPASAVLPPASYERLRKVKATYDPDGVIISVDPVWPAKQ